MKLKGKETGLQKSRGNRIVHTAGSRTEPKHDAYKLRAKLRGPTVCRDCGAVFHEGRWRWAARPAEADEETCPACQRIRDHAPAGMIHLMGPFFKSHREEILNLVRNQEAEAKREHPLCRIMAAKEDDDGVVITTTDTHLPRRIGEALWHAHHGELDLHYGQSPKLVQMTWKG